MVYVVYHNKMNPHDLELGSPSFTIKMNSSVGGFFLKCEGLRCLRQHRNVRAKIFCLIPRENLRCSKTIVSGVEEKDLCAFGIL